MKLRMAISLIKVCEPPLLLYNSSFPAFSRHAKFGRYSGSRKAANAEIRLSVQPFFIRNGNLRHYIDWRSKERVLRGQSLPVDFSTGYTHGPLGHSQTDVTVPLKATRQTTLYGGKSSVKLPEQHMLNNFRDLIGSARHGKTTISEDTSKARSHFSSSFADN